MLQRLFSLFLLFLLFVTEIQCDDVISGSNDKCADYCSKTYPAHTFDQNGAEKSCKQGCRLFSVISAVDKMPGQQVSNDRLIGDENEEKLNLTAISTSCEHECSDAYSDHVFQNACVDGCRHQIPFTTGRLTMVVDENSPLFPFASKLMNQAMGKFREAEEKMKSHFDSLRNLFNNDNMGMPLDKSSSSAEDSEENDNAAMLRTFQRLSDRMRKIFGNMDENPFSKEIENGKKPRLLGGREDIFDHMENHGRNQDASDTAPVVATGHPTHVEGSEFMGNSSVGNSDENGEPILIVKMIPLEGGEDEASERGWENMITEYKPTAITKEEGIYGDADNGWLECLARRSQNLSAMSRWFLCAALMLSILCMLWLCLALVRNQHHRRRRMFAENVATKSDVIYYMPPPAYEKTPASAAYMLLNEEKKEAPPSPPPTYVEKLVEKNGSA